MGGWRGDDRGTSFVEYVGLMALAALVVGVLCGLDTPGTVRDGVGAVVCRILGTSDDCAAPGRTDQGPQPPRKQPPNIYPLLCVSSEVAHNAGSSIAIGNFKIGQDYGVIRIDDNEVDFDGKPKHFVYLAFVPSATIEFIKNNPGAQMNLGSLQLGKQIELSAGLKVTSGDMYRLTPDQADKLTKDIDDYQLRKEMNQIDPHVTAPGFPDLPPVAIRWGSFGGSGNGKVEATPTGKDPVPGSKRYTASAGANGTLSLGAESLTERWNFTPDGHGGTIPQVVSMSEFGGTLSAGVSAGKPDGPVKPGGEGGGSVNVSGAVRVLRDEKTGTLRHIRWIVKTGTGVDVNGGMSDETGTANGGVHHNEGRVKTQVIQINFNDDQQRQVGEQWLRTNGGLPPDSAIQQLVTGHTTEPGADASPMDRLIYDQGTAWQTQGDSSSTAASVGLSLSLPFTVGGDIHWSSSTTKTDSAQILDAPKDGRRSWIDYPACTDQGNQGGH
ncbi:MAG TPA: hypothetical protein VGL93_13930 [Streptosporangiaceae bacterium]